MRAATILWAILAVAAGTSLFMLKYEVQSQEQRLAGLRKDIVEAKESIHVLKAEWSYLNDPARLREQAERHLGLHPLKPGQIVSIASLPMNDTPPGDPSQSQDLTSQNQAAPLPAPAATTTQPAPLATRKVPPAPAARVAPQPAPSRTTPKPVRSMTAEKAVPAPAAKTAAVKPVARKAVIAAAKPLAPIAAHRTEAPRPTIAPQARPDSTHAVALSNTPRAVEPTTVGNVMVIKSPALADPEVASTRVQP